MKKASAAAALALCACAVVLAVVAFSSHVESISTLGYDLTPGLPQPAPGLPPHFSREHDPWARDGISKRGSFTLERKVEHGIHDKYWLVITGKPGNDIRCSVRAYRERRGFAHFEGWVKHYEATTAVVSGLLPCIQKNEFVSVGCTDLTTGEHRYFRLHQWLPEHEKKVEPWETDAAAKWMKEHGLSDFTSESAPLHDTSYEAREDYSDVSQGAEWSKGEEWMFRTGHPPVYVPPYQEEMGGHLSAEEAKEQIPWKGEYERQKEEDLNYLRRGRAWRAYWSAWKAGLKHDKEKGIPRSEWRQHWN